MDKKALNCAIAKASMNLMANHPEYRKKLIDGKSISTDTMMEYVAMEIGVSKDEIIGQVGVSNFDRNIRYGLSSLKNFNYDQIDKDILCSKDTIFALLPVDVKRGARQ